MEEECMELWKMEKKPPYPLSLHLMHTFINLLCNPLAVCFWTEVLGSLVFPQRKSASTY